MPAVVCLFLIASVLATAFASEAADPRAIQAELDAIAADYSRLQSALAQTEGRLVKLSKDLRSADQILRERADAMRQRAGYVYKEGAFGAYVEGLLLAGDPQEFVERLTMLEILGTKDARLVDEIKLLKSRGTQLRRQLNETRRRQQALAGQLKARQRELIAELERAKSATRVTPARAPGGVVLPVLGPATFSDTWGALRSGGRRHKGTDVIAPCGARVVSVTDGWISDLSRGGNGGVMLWLRARDGDIFFYAHLRGYADGVRAGREVRAGELIAYNGNSGNARGGPCHVHFEWHPKGGGPVNPYRLLRAALRG